MDQIQVTYGGNPAPPHGGSGGPNTPFVLNSYLGEFIVDVAINSGGAVNMLMFLTRVCPVSTLDVWSPWAILATLLTPGLDLALAAKRTS